MTRDEQDASDEVRKPHPRVLHVSDAFGGGVETAILQYCEYPGHHTLLIRLRDGASPPAGDSLDAVVCRTRLSLLWRWLRLRHDSRFEFVHAHSSLAGVVTRAFRPTSSLIYSPHGFAFEGHRSQVVRYVARKAERLLGPRAQRACAVSLREADLFRELGVAAEAIVVVPHAIQLSPDPRPSRDRLRVIAVGRVCWQKQPQYMISVKRAWEHQALPEADWVWAGAGDPLLTAQLQDAGVQVTGWLSQDDLASLRADAWVLLHTALYEGMPFAVLECMASGVPVVARDIPPLRELKALQRYSSPEEAVVGLMTLLDVRSARGLANRASAEVRDRYSTAAQHSALAHVYGSVALV